MSPFRMWPPWFAPGLSQQQQTGVPRGTPPIFQPCYGVSYSFSSCLPLRTSCLPHLMQECHSSHISLSSLKKSGISGCSRGPRASSVTNSASVFHRPSWVPRAYATLIQDVFHNLISRFRGLRGFVNLHHFILNCANWKLRDSRVASLLENKRGQGKEVAATYG